MKIVTLIFLIMTTSFASAQNQKASTIKKTFSRQTSVQINIAAEPAIIWQLLTNAADFPRWNSTVTSLKGPIELGNKIHLKVTLDEKRTFKIKVKEFEVNQRMVWGDGKGNRVFTLTANADGTTTFNMTEKMGGLMFPMYAKYIPPFDEPFDQFANDLKKEAEKIQNTKN